jgi:hypothetical protein
MHCNLLCRVCVRIFTFCANFILDSYSAIHTIYLDQTTNQQFTPAQIKHSALSVWHLPLTFEDIWTYLLSCCRVVHSWLLTADCCDAEG